MLDAGYYWFCYGALSDVGYTLTVTDTATGESVSYGNPLGTFGSGSDVTALPGN